MRSASSSTRKSRPERSPRCGDTWSRMSSHSRPGVATTTGGLARSSRSCSTRHVRNRVRGTGRFGARAARRRAGVPVRCLVRRRTTLGSFADPHARALLRWRRGGASQHGHSARSAAVPRRPPRERRRAQPQGRAHLLDVRQAAHDGRHAHARALGQRLQVRRHLRPLNVGAQPQRAHRRRPASAALPTAFLEAKPCPPPLPAPIWPTCSASSRVGASTSARSLPACGEGRPSASSTSRS